MPACNWVLKERESPQHVLRIFCCLLLFLARSFWFVQRLLDSAGNWVATLVWWPSSEKVAGFGSISGPSDTELHVLLWHQTATNGPGPPRPQSWSPSHSGTLLHAGPKGLRSTNHRLTGASTWKCFTQPTWQIPSDICLLIRNQFRFVPFSSRLWAVLSVRMSPGPYFYSNPN